MSRTDPPRAYGGLHVLVAGGGVAGLETLLALRALAGDLVDLELLSEEPEFWYRPLAVAEPFDAGRARHFEVADVAEAVEARFTLGRLASIDAAAHVARTSHGAEIEYGVLVIACGALPRAGVAGAFTFRGPADTERYRRMLAEAEDGAVRSIAFAASGQTGWVLPLYELALLTATTFARRNIHVELTLATPEPAPLSLFGDEASEAMRSLLKDHDIGLRTRCDPSRFAAGRLDLGAGGWLEVDRVVALPRLEGRRILGLEQDADGFVATDLSGRVLGQPDLYAAGDITDFPIKQGGIATQQADVVAEAISARAGAGLEPRRFAPVLRGLLLTGEAPRYLRKEGPTADVADDALWWPPNKIAGRYLAPFLARYGALEMGPPADRAAIEIEVEVESQTGTS